jgi:putative ABC transport system ATP-binding protein
MAILPHSEDLSRARPQRRKLVRCIAHSERLAKISGRLTFAKTDAALMPPLPHPPIDATPEAFGLENVTQERGGRQVLAGVTVDLPKGGFSALIGPSGAGKTSLLRLLNRLDDPASGGVRFLGRPIVEFPVRALRRRVGFVFQAPAMFPGTVGENLAIVPTLGGEAAGTAVPGRIAEILHLVELGTDFEDRIAADLSGGEKQRVALARALMTGPEVLLLDEPTAALDPEVAERLMHTLRRLREDTGLTIVMVTHRLSEARLASTFVVMLEAGRVVEAGPSARFFSAPVEARAREFITAGEEGNNHG